MGWNTGVIVLNDALGGIESHPEEFVQGLSEAMARFHRSSGEPTDIRCGGHCNAASVFHQSHADNTGIYAIGGNHTSRLLLTHNGGKHYQQEDKVRLLKELAQELGYRVVKLSSKE